MYIYTLSCNIQRNRENPDKTFLVATMTKNLLEWILSSSSSSIFLLMRFFTLFGPLVMYPTICAADMRNLNLNLKKIAGEDAFTLQQCIIDSYIHTLIWWALQEFKNQIIILQIFKWSYCRYCIVSSLHPMLYIQETHSYFDLLSFTRITGRYKFKN